MKRKWILIMAMSLVFAMLCTACAKGAEPSGTPSGRDKTAGTMADVKQAVDPKKEFPKLDEIYFPEGIFDTGMGMYIWNDSAKSWVRTNTAEGKALFRADKPTMIFAHGKGGNATVDRPAYFYARGYNVVSFLWGTFARERDSIWYVIADKIWFREGQRWIPDLGSDDDSENNVEKEDVPNVTVAEIYGAFYYDLFAAFPDYSGSEIRIFGHSYGGMLTGALISYLTASYKNGFLPAYMLPDRVDFLDPYFSFATETLGDVPWLGEEGTPAKGNVNEAIYQAILVCRELGIVVGLDRTFKPVCYPTTLLEYNVGKEEVTQSYWDFCNNIVYAHMSTDSSKAFGSQSDFFSYAHGYGWDWYDNFSDGTVLSDTSALVPEEAYCFFMPYEKMYAKAGIKYLFDVNGTLDPVDDDIVTSFFFNYENDPEYIKNDAFGNPDEDPEFAEEFAAGCYKSKAKIAGFAYVDANGNGVMDERLVGHFHGLGVVVKNAAGEVIYEGKTGLNGYYEAQTDVAGEYTVEFSAPKGYEVARASVTVTVVDTERQVAINNVAVASK